MPDRSTRTRIGNRFGYYDENGNYHDRRKEIAHIGDAFGFYQNGQYVTHRQLTRKPPISFQKRVRGTWRALNKPREFILTPGKGLRAVFLLVLLGLGVLFITDQWLKESFSTIPASTASQQLWSENLASSDLSAWNTRLTVFCNLCPGTEKSLEQDSNSTHSAIAITKNPIALDSASAKQLSIEASYIHGATPTNAGLRWGWFFTTNNTLPNEQATWNPKDDNEVVSFLEVFDNGGGSITNNLYIQKAFGDSISSGDTGFVNQGGTRFITGSCTQNTGTTMASRNEMLSLYNFTGADASQNNKSWITVCSKAAPATDFTTLEFPWFQIQGQSYYFGFWLEQGTSTPIRWPATGTTALFIRRSSPLVPISPNLDTGGFFGPLVRALVSLGIFILEGIARFFGFVADVFVTAMNSVGAFFGLGAIGTAIRDALVGVGTWVSGVFGTIFAQGISIATAISNTLSAAVQVTGTYWTQLTSWISSISDLLSLFWPFISFFGVGIPFSALMTYWLIQGIIMSYNSRDGAFQWMRWTWILSATLFNIMWAIGERAFDVILNVKRLLAQWL